jgi:hypothetical protein
MSVFLDPLPMMVYAAVEGQKAELVAAVCFTKQDTERVARAVADLRAKNPDKGLAVVWDEWSDGECRKLAYTYAPEKDPIAS